MIVAPHGHKDNDYNTDVIADIMATELNASAVINTGWARGPKAILAEGIANLNDLQHCKLNMVKDEFLDPIVEFKKKCIQDHDRCYIFYIHGMHENVRTTAQDDRLDMVLGCGQGDPPSYTCSLMFKNALAKRLREESFVVYQAKSGGKFAAWRKDNLNQYFRQHVLDDRVSSIQIEIINSLRNTIDDAIRTALRMTRAVDKLVNQKTTYNKNIYIKEY